MPRLLQTMLALAAGCSLLACRGPAASAMAANNGQAATPSANPAAPQGNGPMTPTPRGATLQATAGQTVTIVLAGLASAGYEWQLAEGAFDAKVLRFAGKRTGAIPGPVMPGASAQELFDFVGVAAGSTQVKLVQLRPWEGRQADSETATFTVQVR